MIVVLPILSFYFLIIILGIYCEQREIYDCKNKPTLKFKDFKRYYFLNPNSWELKYCTVVKAEQEFSFSFFGTILYMNFYKKKRKKEENNAKQERDKQAYIKLLNSVQKDINTIRKKANKEIEESSKIIIRVKENFMKEEI